MSSCLALQAIRTALSQPELEDLHGDDRYDFEIPPIRDLSECAKSGCRFCNFVAKHPDIDDDFQTGRLWRTSAAINDESDAAAAWLSRPNGAGLRAGHAWQLVLELTEDDYHLPLFLDAAPEVWVNRLSAPEAIDAGLSDLAMMHHWLADCSQHPNCSSAGARQQEPVFLPTRLLDLKARSAEANAEIRLVETSDSSLSSIGPDAQYTALSYCWGGDVSQKTVRGNLDAHKKQIAYDSLPLTIRDAISITRALGFRYLWIDSLCVIQEDEEDWTREAARMAQVYGYSALTLTAESALDCDKGCRVRPQPQHLWQSGDEIMLDRAGEYAGRPWAETRSWAIPDVIDVTLEDKRVFRVFNRSLAEGDDREVERYRSSKAFKPLSYRGWALQERELSGRIMSFTVNEVMWKCCSLEASATQPWGHASQSSSRQSSYMQGKVVGLSDKQIDDHASDAGVEAASWYEAVEDYSKRQFSKKSDKLPALAGLASRSQSRFPQARYLAGLWEYHLPAALLWRANHDIFEEQQARLQKPRAPSWSWASVQSEVSYVSQRYSREGVLVDQATAPIMDGWLTEVLDAHCDLSTTMEYGAVNGGLITLRGPLVQMAAGTNTLNITSDFGMPPCAKYCHVLDESDEPIGWFWPDVWLEFIAIPQSPKSLNSQKLDGGRRDVYCLAICEETPYPAEPWPGFMGRLPDGIHESCVMGLVLLPVNDYEGIRRFERLGLFRWLRRDAFDGEPHSTIQIV